MFFMTKREFIKLTLWGFLEWGGVVSVLDQFLLVLVGKNEKGIYKHTAKNYRW